MKNTHFSMKQKTLSLLLTAGLTLGSLTACGSSTQTPQETSSGAETEMLTVAAATYPVYLLACAVAEGAEGVEIVPVINQSMACVHDYTLTVNDMKVIEGADVILLSGAGLEDFMGDSVDGKDTVDCAQGVELLTNEEGETDPHIWMDPTRAAQMAENIAAGLAQLDPDNGEVYQTNGGEEAETLRQFAETCQTELAELSCRELITFHEGFAYLADAFDLTILAAIEEEAGSEASAKTVEEMVSLVREYDLPTIFVEANGSDSTAQAISRECGVSVDTLTMMMSGPETYSADNCYQTYLQSNIDTLKEALS